jgi:hypothetical protein
MPSRFQSIAAYALDGMAWVVGNPVKLVSLAIVAAALWYWFA